jgi:hypothetical protein
MPQLSGQKDSIAANCEVLVKPRPLPNVDGPIWPGVEVSNPSVAKALTPVANVQVVRSLKVETAALAELTTARATTWPRQDLMDSLSPSQNGWTARNPNAAGQGPVRTVFSRRFIRCRESETWRGRCVPPGALAGNSCRQLTVPTDDAVIQLIEGLSSKGVGHGGFPDQA